MTIMNMALVETLSCSLQTRNTKFLIAPRWNQVSMSMCLNKESCTRVADKSAETSNNKPFENKLQSVCWFF